MIPSRSSIFLCLEILCSSVIFLGSVVSQEVPSLTKKQDLTLIGDNDDSYRTLEEDVLGTEDMTPLKGSWAITVNDQCLYEFVYEFEHNIKFPIGQESFTENCDFGDVRMPIEPKIAHDGLPFLKPRRHFERFPDYVWVTMGFNHLSIDWLPCGRRPAGYKAPQYDLSFFRVTPEYRTETMTCKVTNNTAVPFEDVCDSKQDDVKGMNMFVVPGAMISPDPVVNMPVEFTPRHRGYGPLPHYGLRSWDEAKVPETPAEWDDIPIFMSTYAGHLVMWQAHVPYKMMKGEERKFHSNADRYFHTTIQTLPDTWAVKYNELTGKVHFTIVGKAELCREDFERAQKAAGGPPVFPDYETIYRGSVNDPKNPNKSGYNPGDEPSNTEEEEEDDEYKPKKSGSSTSLSVGASILPALALLFALTNH